MTAVARTGTWALAGAASVMIEPILAPPATIIGYAVYHLCPVTGMTETALPVLRGESWPETGHPMWMTLPSERGVSLWPEVSCPNCPWRGYILDGRWIPHQVG